MAGQRFAVCPSFCNRWRFEVGFEIVDIATAQRKESILGYVSVSIIGEFSVAKTSLTETICPRWS